jgi:hypothetical protein
MLQQKKAAKSREQDEDLVRSFGKGFALPISTNLADQKQPIGNMLLDQVSESFNTKDARGDWSKRGIINKHAMGGSKKKKVLSKKQKQRAGRNQDRGEADSEKRGGKMVKQKRKHRMNKLKKIY